MKFYCVFYCVRTQRIVFGFIVFAQRIAHNESRTPGWFYCVRPLKGRTHNKTIRARRAPAQNQPPNESPNELAHVAHGCPTLRSCERVGQSPQPLRLPPTCAFTRIYEQYPNVYAHSRESFTVASHSRIGTPERSSAREASGNADRPFQTFVREKKTRCHHV
jgi:hypothetical protein